MLLRGTFFPQIAASALFLEEISFLGILRELSRVARRTWRNFLLHSKSLLAFLTHTHTRNYYFIGTLPGFVIKLISEGKADFDGCKGPFTLPTDLSSIEDIEKIDLSSLGGRLQGRTIPSGTFFCFWRTSAQFFKKFLLSESCSNFLEWLAELEKIPGDFPRSIRTLMLTHKFD